MRVVEDAHDRLVPAGQVEESKHAQPHQERIRGNAVDHSGGHAQCLLLAGRQRPGVRCQGHAEQVQGRVRHRGLGLEPVGPHHPGAAQVAGDLSEQGGLAHTGIAADHERSTSPVPGTQQDRTKRPHLVGTPHQPIRPPGHASTYRQVTEADQAPCCVVDRVA